jgi:hypothetical protein
MTNKQTQESNPQKESNDDKGDQKTYQNPDPQKNLMKSLRIHLKSRSRSKSPRRGLFEIKCLHYF